MSSDVERYVIRRILETPIVRLPFPHFYIEGVFPPDYYERLLAAMPADADFASLAGTGRVPKGSYPQRFIRALTKDAVAALPDGQREFWGEFASWFMAKPFFYALCHKFADGLRGRFGDAPLRLAPETLLVRDRTDYEIGPHTDAPHRFLSLLFYCPADESHAHLGTSLYQPIDRHFRCQGGPHHPFDQFVKIATMPYRPNTMFGFLKTDYSFHGVEPVGDPDVKRDLILYNIRVANVYTDGAA